VDEGSGVHHLHDRTEANGSCPLIAAQLCGEQEKRGTQALAAPGAQVFRDSSDRTDAGDGCALELVLYGDEVVSEEIEDFTGRECGGGAH